MLRSAPQFSARSGEQVSSNCVYFGGRERRYYAMPYRQYYIWGATAGMLMNFYGFLTG